MDRVTPAKGRMIVEAVSAGKDSLSNKAMTKYIAVEIGLPCQFRPVNKKAVGCEVLIDNTRFGHSFERDGRRFLVVEQASVSAIFDK